VTYGAFQELRGSGFFGEEPEPPRAEPGSGSATPAT
jgi:hypothetical protein